MDNQFAFSNSLSPNYKLSRAASFSELSTSKKVTFQEKYELTHGGLIKQYSCEQIFDQNSDKSQLRISQIIEFNKDKPTNTWRTTSLKSIKDQFSILPETPTMSNLQKKSSFPNQWFSPLEQNRILAPPKLVLSKDHLQDRLGDLNLNNHNVHNNMSKQEDNQDLNFFKKPLPPRNLTKNLEKETISSETLLKKQNFKETLPQKFSEKDKNEDKIDIADLKKKLRSLVVVKEKEIKKKHRVCQFFLLMFWFILSLSPIFILISVLVINSDFSNEICNPLFKFDNLSENIKKHVYGQDTAINYLSKYFNEKNNKTDFDVLVFVGGIGVGKSYTAEIIKNNLKENVNLLEYFPPLYNKVQVAFTSLSICKCNLIRLDNLKTYDILDTVQFIVELKKLASSSCTLILAMFNPEETDFNLKRTLDLDKSVMEISNTFKNSNINPMVLKFEPLKDEVLIRCINDAANYVNVDVDMKAVEIVKRDLILAESGCKGAYSKVQLVGKPKKHLKIDL